jgi:arginine decarboxylase
VQLKEDALSLFRHGFLDLKGRARAEKLFWGACDKIWLIVRELDYVPDDLDNLEKRRWPTPTTATSRCSSRCPTRGR